VFIIAMVLVVHQQWSRHELLPYPLADFTAEMIHRRPGHSFPTVFYAPRFWVGFGLTFTIQFVRWIHEWHPHTMIHIPLEWALWIVQNRFPDYNAHGLWSWAVLHNQLRLSVVAFAFFVPTDVSFSLGLGTIAVSLFSLVLWKFGVSYTMYHHTSSLFGAYLAMFLVILYLGRRYYGNVLRAALFLRPKDEIQAEIRWAARVMLAAYLAMVLCCRMIGLATVPAILLVSVLAIMFLVLARIVAETGNVCVQSWWVPMDMLFKLLGATALGPYTISLMSLISTPVSIDARECLSCFMVNGFRLCDREEVPRLKTGLVTAAVLVPCLVLAFAVVLWVNYNGRHTGDAWSHGVVPQRVFDRVATAVSTLEREPELFERVLQVERGDGVGPVKGLLFRLRHIQVAPGVLPWVVFGFLGLLACAAMRLRFTWWFLHPVFFLYWGTPPAVWFAASFLVGAAAKASVVRYGGGRMYQSLKPFFSGAIMGELAIVGVMMVFNVAYFIVQDVAPVTFFVFPR
jgi:hypothetical protein